jgi:hypothetical protein
MPAVFQLPQQQLPLSLVRPEDQLVLHFTFAGLTLSNGVLHRIPGRRRAVVVVHFESQHLGEQAFPTDEKKAEGFNLPASGAALARAAGPSRLAVLVPDDVDAFECTAAKLLQALSDWEPSVVQTALPPPSLSIQLQGAPPPPPDPKIPPQAPSSIQTAIEAPFRLVLSPNRRGAWLHALAPVRDAAGTRTELWHTALGERLTPGPLAPGEARFDGRRRYVRPKPDGELTVDALMEVPFTDARTVRAVQSLGSAADDPDHVVPGDPDRTQLVNLTSDFKTFPNTRRRVVRADRLMLSALGAWLDLDYADEDRPLAFKLVAWRHRAAAGRDSYARVVHAGCYCPIKHRAVRIEVNERMPQRRTGDPLPDAVLRNYRFLVSREFERAYPAPLQDDDARRMPFRRIRLLTRRTPELTLDPAFTPGPGEPDVQWPTLGDRPYLFHLWAEDWEGRPHDFHAPLLWIDGGFTGDGANSSFDPGFTDKVLDAYTGADNGTRCQVSLHGQKVAFAPADTPDSTSLVCDTITFGFTTDDASLAACLANKEPAFWPVVTSATVKLPAAEQLSGAPPTLKVGLDDSWVSSGAMGGGEVFAQVTSGGALGFSGDESGGVLTPHLTFDGLSRTHGPVSRDAAINGSFDPSQLLAGLDARILGGISLVDVVTGGPLSQDTAPKLTSMRTGTELVTKLTWTPKLTDHTPFVPKADAALSITATATVDTTGAGQPETEVHGSITNFLMDLWGFVQLPFTQMTFDAPPGKKPDFSATLGPVEFGGPLAFVNDLRKHMGGNGFSDPPSLDVTAEGVKLAYSLELPAIPAGIMSLTNVSFGAGLSLPFTGDPARLRFAFCERERPFCLTVYCFGGGGFFGIALGLDGVEQIEASLEFGAEISIDIGVASGGVHLMAGIYFSWVEAENKTLLEGYLRMGGELEVLGIVSVSLEFEMSLSYESDGGDGIVWGEAELTVEIEVAMFSKSVSMKAHRQFGDPPPAYFHVLLPEAVWTDEYLGAFA